MFIPYAFRHQVVPHESQIDCVADPWNESNADAVPKAMGR